jgi:hypothetical protein
VATCTPTTAGMPLSVFTAVRSGDFTRDKSANVAILMKGKKCPTQQPTRRLPSCVF